MRAVRTFLLVFLVMVGLLGMALPASAHFTQFEVTGILWNFGSGNGFTAVQVTFTCTDGEKYRIRTDVDIKPDYHGIGVVTGRCTGSQQQRWIESEKQSGDLRVGRARVVARGSTFVAGVQHGERAKDVEFL